MIIFHSPKGIAKSGLRDQINKEVRCFAINSVGHKGADTAGKQCCQMTKNTGNPSFCGNHRGVLKRRPLMSLEGRTWTNVEFRTYLLAFKNGK